MVVDVVTPPKQATVYTAEVEVSKLEIQPVSVVCVLLHVYN